MTAKRVAVIGAGAGGLTAAKALKDRNMDVQIFEAGDDIGGQWSPSSESAVWSSLYMNQSRRVSEFSDFPWDKAVPSPPFKDFAGLYPNAAEATSYLHAYAEKFDLRRHVKFNCPVQSVTLSDDRWRVETTTDVATFDFLVVATGRSAHPYDPLNSAVDGPLKNFAGERMHSSKFRHVIDDLKGKRVLVIGNSVSGSEIVTEAVSRGASYVAHSFRRAKYMITTLARGNDNEDEKKNGTYYRPTDEVFFSRLPVWLGRVLPEKMNAAGLKGMVEKHFEQPQKVGEEFKPSDDIFEAGVFITRLPYHKYVDSGEIQLKPLPTKTDGTRNVTFANESVEEFDLIITATGYEIKIDFLPPSFHDILVHFHDGMDLALYKHTMVPSQPNLAFIGLFRMIGGAFPGMEMQARWIAEVFSGGKGLPSQYKMERAVEAWREKRSRPGHGYVMITELEEDIADELSLSPGYVTALLDKKRRLTGPLFPCEYRAFSHLDSDEVVEAARDTLRRYTEMPSVALLTDEEKAELRLQEA